MLKVCDQLKDKPADGIAAVARSELKKLARPDDRSYVSEVHSDWFVQTLRDESPLVIATVLRNLPAERVHDILEKLPPDVMRDLPKISDTYATDPCLVDMMRRKFEELFPIDGALPPGTTFAFGHFPYLKARPLRAAFAELGYREIGLGLAALPEMTRILVLNRLLPEDKRRVETYMARELDPLGLRTKRAQVHLISREVDPRKPDLFVREVGFLVFAKALLPEDHSGIEIVKRKMPMRESRALIEAVEQYSRANTEASVIPYREDVIAAVKTVLGGTETVPKV